MVFAIREARLLWPEEPIELVASFGCGQVPPKARDKNNWKIAEGMQVGRRVGMGVRGRVREGMRARGRVGGECEGAREESESERERESGRKRE